MDKSDANLAALEALSGQDISAVGKMAFQKVRSSPIYEHCSNDRSWPILLIHSSHPETGVATLVAMHAKERRLLSR
ncbi:hypothetical protein [Paraburkholderia pallida]|uniref:Uncharacterized protein n=1 Tax=Paraburkholderia pallida TaxID=2547399 RepID=A0A4P7D8N9_9BURK|nr:hypothetical protein [Paraburkholderia pallida]QBR03194.1 hypothetical protein E1956_39225 [Paraburkholderia pallida]